MAAVILRANKHEKPVFKLFVNFSCLQNYQLAIWYVPIMHQPITVSSNTCSQMNLQIKHSLTHLQDLILTFAGIKYICKHTSQSRDQIL